VALDLPTIEWLETPAANPFDAARRRRIEVQQQADDGSWQTIDTDDGENVVTVV